MNEKTVTVGSSTFTLKRNVRKMGITSSQYLERLFGAYAGRRDALDAFAQLQAKSDPAIVTNALISNPLYTTAISWQNQARDFANVASYIVSGTMVTPNDWPKSDADVEPIKQAFEWLLDNPDVWDALDAAIKEIELPNGEVGAPPAMVGTVPSDSPLASAAPNGSENTAVG